ncbi:hypothetical protein ACFQRB_19660 [Halobaculum litoreum]|uniref:Uncharacterized protein n=1 Tax=Halobaculum litoreum TaxID=3031998 RepID=A0ABD5XYC7_9EURY
MKGVLGGAVLAGFGATGSAAVNSLTSPQGTGGGVTQYVGNTLIDGPAPRGMPQVPVRIDDEGYIRGVWPTVGQAEQGGRQVSVAEMEPAASSTRASGSSTAASRTPKGSSPMRTKTSSSATPRTPPTSGRRPT